MILTVHLEELLYNNCRIGKQKFSLKWVILSSRLAAQRDKSSREKLRWITEGDAPPPGGDPGHRAGSGRRGGGAPGWSDPQQRLYPESPSVCSHHIFFWWSHEIRFGNCGECGKNTCDDNPVTWRRGPPAPVFRVPSTRSYNHRHALYVVLPAAPLFHLKWKSEKKCKWSYHNWLNKTLHCWTSGRFSFFLLLVVWLFWFGFG